jgi:hypothetical protein
MLQLMLPLKNQGAVPTPEEFHDQLQIFAHLAGLCRQAEEPPDEPEGLPAVSGCL